MGAGMIFDYAPNKVDTQYTTSETTWHVIASDGASYTTLALLLAAGKVPWPGLDAGFFLQRLRLRSQATGNVTTGALFLAAVNRATAPTDATAELIDPALGPFEFRGPITNVWIRKTTGTDIINLLGEY